MKSFTAISCLFALVTAAPTPAFINHVPTVQLRTIGPENTHYTSPNQTPSRNGHIITLVIGTALSSLAQNPLLLQGFEIVDAEGDGDVYCKASINNSSEGVVISRKDGMVMLNGVKGNVVEVTGLSCGFGEESMS
jgi:hypothetical protein